MHTRPVFLCLLLPLAALAVQPGTYIALKGESRLAYHLHHPLHDVTGISTSFACTVEIAGDSLRPKVLVKAALASFNSGNASRDSHVLELLKAYQFPHVIFAGDSAIAEGADHRLFGKLTFRGVTRPIDFPAAAERGDGKIRVHGEFTILLSDYGIKRPTLLMIPTDDELQIEIDVVAEE